MNRHTSHTLALAAAMLLGNLERTAGQENGGTDQPARENAAAHQDPPAREHQQASIRARPAEQAAEETAARADPAPREETNAALAEPRWVLFTPQELERARAIAEERERLREKYLRAWAREEIITLEPYIIEGDSSLLLARLRRDLATGYRQGPLVLPPRDRAVLRLARRVDTEFFGFGLPGSVLRSEPRPRDAGSMLLLDPVALAERVRDGDLRNIFAAPPALE